MKLGTTVCNVSWVGGLGGGRFARGGTRGVVWWCGWFVRRENVLTPQDPPRCTTHVVKAGACPTARSAPVLEGRVRRLGGTFLSGGSFAVARSSSHAQGSQ